MFEFRAFMEAKWSERYTLWLLCDRQQSDDLLPFVVTTNPDGRTFQGTVTSFTNAAKEFTSPQAAESWLRKNAPHFQFYAPRFAVVKNEDWVSAGGNAYSYPFQWQSVH